ncbi:DUF2946 family protein [Rhodopseudomonas sp.]|uniref:DUF2946 family protein n=1 Tax=Rhodopseudomonas sp. TaxID=1078 RepID=UPI0025FF9B39|nr:DUF2946 family protein [Rhodopseudomonas sp.]
MLPIVAIALLVQVMAPIGAFRVVAQSVSDPLAMASICSGIATADHGSTAPSGTHGNDGCCAICAAGLGGPPMPEPAALAFVKLQRQYQSIVWLDAIDSPTANRVGSNAQPRAPPFPIRT